MRFLIRINRNIKVKKGMVNKYINNKSPTTSKKADLKESGISSESKLWKMVTTKGKTTIMTAFSMPRNLTLSGYTFLKFLIIKISSPTASTTRIAM